MTAVARRTVLAGLLAASACAIPSPPACSPGLSLAAETTLYFGRAIPGGGTVGDADWALFLDEVATPRFPDGFTVLDGAGQYRGQDGTLVREPSKVLVVLALDPAVGRRLADEIGAAYKARFSQESVLIVEQSACAAF